MNEDDWDWFDEQAEAEDDFDGVPDLDELDDRFQAGAEHLRAAAREMIAASRALLDVAEEIVEDPHAVRDLAGFIGSLGNLVGKGLGPWAGGTRHEGGADDDPDDPAVERIPIS
jgi:hypothetical protein